MVPGERHRGPDNRYKPDKQPYTAALSYDPCEQEGNVELTWWGWLLTIAAVLISGIAKSGFGGGVGIVAVPMFVLAMGPVSGVGTLLPLLVAADVLTVWHHWGRWDKRNLSVLMPGTLIGTAIGYAIMRQIDARGLELGIGVICILYVALDQVRRSYAPHWKLKADYPAGGVAGISSGIVSYLAHAAGPVIQIFLLGQHLNKNTLVGTAAIYFLLLNTLKIPPYLHQGLIDSAAIQKGLWLVPLVPLGTWIGARLHHGMSELIFRRVVISIVFLTGIQMMIGMKTIATWLSR